MTQCKTVMEKERENPVRSVMFMNCLQLVNQEKAYAAAADTVVQIQRVGSVGVSIHVAHRKQINIHNAIFSKFCLLLNMDILHM